MVRLIPKSDMSLSVLVIIDKSDCIKPNSTKQNKTEKPNTDKPQKFSICYLETVSFLNQWLVTKWNSNLDSNLIIFDLYNLDQQNWMSEQTTNNKITQNWKLILYFLKKGVSF